MSHPNTTVNQYPLKMKAKKTKLHSCHKLIKKVITKSFVGNAVPVSDKLLLLTDVSARPIYAQLFMQAPFIISLVAPSGLCFWFWVLFCFLLLRV